MAVNLKNKKTTLGEEASIYASRDENKSEKERWSEMTKEERKRHFKEYYLRSLILLVVAIAAIGYMAYDAIRSYRNQELFVAVINDRLEPEAKEALADDLMALLELNPKKDKVTIDDDFILTGTAEDTNTLQRLTAYIYSETLDVIIADPETFNTYLKNGVFVNLRDILSPELLELHNEFIYRPIVNESWEDVEVIKEYGSGEPFGLRMKGNQYHGLGLHQPNSIIGVVGNSKKMEHAALFLQLLFPY